MKYEGFRVVNRGLIAFKRNELIFLKTMNLLFLKLHYVFNGERVKADLHRGTVDYEFLEKCRGCGKERNYTGAFQHTISL